ncbi:MAG: hypothetical protein ACI9UK_001875, partial [Candidatus Krumholzibacteriia bacterium]
MVGVQASIGAQTASHIKPLDDSPRNNYIFPMNKKHKTLKEEIQQSKDFSNLEAEVYLNLLRTTEALGAEVN